MAQRPHANQLKQPSNVIWKLFLFADPFNVLQIYHTTNCFFKVVSLKALFSTSSVVNIFRKRSIYKKKNCSTPPYPYPVQILSHSLPKSDPGCTLCTLSDSPTGLVGEPDQAAPCSLLNLCLFGEDSLLENICLAGEDSPVVNILSCELKLNATSIPCSVLCCI